ncbi:MAG: hypothetical protein CMJ25_28210 [Phycisphaerae bacterium]|nr:hypothetical protein [Phycisphaerae bacterium]|tara:strand:+ start:9752 stop:10273 length:522 start_codon:yes stop_codon:yes gene_type:complete
MIKEIEITFSAGHYAFAIVQDDFSQAYVPSSVMAAAPHIEVGRRYNAGIVENRNNDRRHATPWFVTYIPREDVDNEGSVFSPLQDLFEKEPEVIETVKTMTELVHEATPLMNGEPFLANELAAHIGAGANDVSTVLYNMHRSGKIAVAKIYKSADQVRSTQTVWCQDVKRLLK